MLIPDGNYSFLYSWVPELFEREGTNSFIFDFQNLLAGLFTLIAGLFVIFAAKNTIEYEKTKNLDRYYIEKATLASAIRAELKSVQTQVRRLEILDTLKYQKEVLEKSKNKGDKTHVFLGSYFFVKNEILPVYLGNIDKIGLLDPNIAEIVVTTASLIKSSAKQIELVGEKSLNKKELNMDEADYIIFLALTTTTQTLESIDLCLVELKKLIDANYGRLSSVNDYF